MACSRCPHHQARRGVNVAVRRGRHACESIAPMREERKKRQVKGSRCSWWIHVSDAQHAAQEDHPRQRSGGTVLLPGRANTCDTSPRRTLLSTTYIYI